MSSPDGDGGRQLFERAAELAARAVAFDRSGHQEAAVYHYVQAAGALLEARKCGATIAHLEKRANDYLSRAEQLSDTGETAAELRKRHAVGDLLCEWLTGSLRRAVVSTGLYYECMFDVM